MTETASKSKFKPLVLEYFRPDPADRLIVTTARMLGAALVTGDGKIRRYPHVRTLW